MFFSSVLRFSSDCNSRKKIPRPIDLSEVIDFKSILDKYNCHGELMEGVTALQCDFHRPIFCLKNRPGCQDFCYSDFTGFS